jgi:hypothetical protein
MRVLLAIDSSAASAAVVSYSFLRAVRIALLFIPLFFALRVDLSLAKHTNASPSVQSLAQSKESVDATQK